MPSSLSLPSPHPQPPQGAAFGFSSIAGQAQQQLAPYLPSMVPRLYRYKHDPSPGIQQAMSNIWSALVPDSKRALDKYLGEILEDLLVNLNSSLWRNRQARWVRGRGGDGREGEVKGRAVQLCKSYLSIKDILLSISKCSACPNASL